MFVTKKVYEWEMGDKNRTCSFVFVKPLHDIVKNKILELCSSKLIAKRMLENTFEAFIKAFALMVILTVLVDSLKINDNSALMITGGAVFGYFVAKWICLSWDLFRIKKISKELCENKIHINEFIKAFSEKIFPLWKNYPNEKFEFLTIRRIYDNFENLNDIVTLDLRSIEISLDKDYLRYFDIDKWETYYKHIKNAVRIKGVNQYGFVTVEFNDVKNIENIMSNEHIKIHVDENMNLTVL